MRFVYSECEFGWRMRVLASDGDSRTAQQTSVLDLVVVLWQPASVWLHDKFSNEGQRATRPSLVPTPPGTHAQRVRPSLRERGWRRELLGPRHRPPTP
eukprot:3132799-Pleurochrysis_carterae.AAC.6